MTVLIDGFSHEVGQVCHLTSVRDLCRFTGYELSEPVVCETGNASMFAYIEYSGRTLVVFLGRPFDFFKRWSSRTGSYLMEKEKSSSFMASWRQARRLVDQGRPVVLGPLDLRYLPFCPVEFEVPWHYVVLVGYEDGNALIYDNRVPDLQTVALDDLDRAWKRRSIQRGPYAFTLFEPAPQIHLPGIILESLRYTADIYLSPPMEVLGIPGMRKLAAEIGRWPDILSSKGLKTAVWSFILQLDMRKSHMFSRFLLEAKDILGWKDLRHIADRIFDCDESWTGIRYELKDADAENQIAKVLPMAGIKIAQLAEREEKSYMVLANLISSKS